MNILYRIILSVLLGLSFTGCSKYLEEKSQDEIKPSSVDELQQLMMGEVYPAGSWTASTFNAYLDMMTDDVSSNFNPDKSAVDRYRAHAPFFTWKDDMFELAEAARTGYAIDTYEHYYHRIMGCNVVLDMIDNARGAESARENVRGQALAMRSFCYFMLVNLYAQPYNAPGIDINKAPGVELMLTSVVSDDNPVRVPIARVYEQIESDLLKALPLIAANGKSNSKYRVTEGFVHTLLSRLYLYQEKWELSKQYATSALALNSSLFNLTKIIIGGYLNTLPSSNVYSPTSTETIWMGYGSTSEYSPMKLSPGGDPVFEVSPELQSLYTYNWTNTTNRGDLRLRYYYDWDYEDGCCWYISYCAAGGKYGKGQGYNPIKGMRVAELFLNRAEANIQLYLKNGDEALRLAALNDLNRLRESRYDTRNVPYAPVDYSGTALLNFYREERRRELSFEDHRWFDLRRYGMPEIRHKFQTEAGQQPVEYVLKQGDKRYVLPFRRSVLAKNPALEPNP